MTGTTHEVKLTKAIFNLLPNRTLAELVIANMREVGRSVLMPFEAPVAGGRGGLRSMKLSAWMPGRAGGPEAG